MRIRSFEDSGQAAEAAAWYVRECSQNAIKSRGEFTCAFSGGSTPLAMFEKLADCNIHWAECALFQVDERVLPQGHENRNYTQLEKALINRCGVPGSAVHPMPVEGDDLVDAAAEYSRDLETICGTPPILDLVALGLGGDGHTASLVPGDPVLDSELVYVDLTGEYNGTRRMTLTFQVLNSTRNLLWLVTGLEKAHILKRLLDSDPALPASRVNRTHAMIFADQAAMSEIYPG
jgi:6-phosphogluconolactonase